jgi:HK97 family phage prohead protease
MAELIYKQFTSENKSVGEGTVEAIVSTNSVDRHGEIVDIEGLDLRPYLANPVVLWAHDASSLPVAKTIGLIKEGGRLIARMQFAVKESAFAKEVYDLLVGGYLNAFSIGFVPHEMDGNRYTKGELLEYSVVPVPANAEALVVAREAGLSTKQVEKHLGDFYHAQKSEYEREKVELENQIKELRKDLKKIENSAKREKHKHEVSMLIKDLKEVTRTYEQRFRK